MDFLPALVEYTGILTELTTMIAEKKFPPWTDHFQCAFQAIKSIVVSQECLTTIDLSKLPEYKIFVTTNVSDKHSGAVLSFSKTWTSASVRRSGSVRFFAPKTGNRGPQPVQDQPRY